MNNAMIDLETLGTDQDSIIISIGACKFDPMTGKIDKKNTFYTRIDWENSIFYERKISADTLKWWMKQDEAARLEVLKPGIDLDKALEDLAAWIKDYKRIKVWGNGATFDISMLENAYKTIIGAVPWEFWNVRDVRTVVDMGRQLTGFDVKKVEREGTHHNALADAIHQATYVSMIYSELDDRVRMEK